MWQFQLYDCMKYVPPNYKYKFQSGQFKFVRTKNILPLHKPVETGQIWQKLNNNNNNNNNNNKVFLKIAYVLHARDQK